METTNRMIDLHAHILPGIDDGADNMEDALEMARMSWNCGVKAITATPHFDPEEKEQPHTIMECVRKMGILNQKLQEEGRKLHIFPGMEIYATTDLVPKIREGAVISLNVSQYYLVEFPFDVSYERIEYILYRMLSQPGMVPVIAHPERYDCVQRRPEKIFHWVSMGAMTQVNKGSLLERFGVRAMQTSRELIDHNLITCVASDAHAPYRRTTDMEQVETLLREEYSAEYADLLLRLWPGKILENKPVEMRAFARTFEYPFERRRRQSYR